MADKKKLKFKDTFLGDLIGADGKIGVQGKGLGASLRGERRKADPAPTKAKTNASTNAKSKLAPSTSARPKPRPESNTKTAVAKGSNTASKRFEIENNNNRIREKIKNYFAKDDADREKRNALSRNKEANLKARPGNFAAVATRARLQEAADDSMALAVKKAAILTRASKMTPAEAARRKDAIVKYKQDKKDATKKTGYQLLAAAGVSLGTITAATHDLLIKEIAVLDKVIASKTPPASVTPAVKADASPVIKTKSTPKVKPKVKSKAKLGRGGGFGVYNINDPLNEGIDENLGKPKAFSRGGYSSKKKK